MARHRWSGRPEDKASQHSGCLYVEIALLVASLILACLDWLAYWIF
jgi:hypothetical protein